MRTERHAYLILAHKNWNQLIKLVELLDDERNDIYIHIDKKSQIGEDILEMIRRAVAKSKICFVDRVEVQWGDYSVIEAEFRLLRAAVNENYQYFHLISGMDLPLKSQNEIHEYFDRHNGKEFIQFLDDEWTRKTQTRVRYYWFFQGKLGSRREQSPIYVIQRLLLGLQKLIGINRCRKYTARTGAQWVSITRKFATCLCDNEQLIEKRFAQTFCPDEWMMQTIAIENGFTDFVYCLQPVDTRLSIQRYIDWERGTPYIFRASDYDELMESDCLFARKFDETIDNVIIDKIYLSVHKD